MADISEGPRSVSYLPLEWRLQNHASRAAKLRIVAGTLLVLVAVIVACHWLMGLF